MSDYDVSSADISDNEVSGGDGVIVVTSVAMTFVAMASVVVMALAVVMSAVAKLVAVTTCGDDVSGGNQ